MANDQVRIARALEVIARHNQEMIRVFAAMNENLAGMGKILAKLADVQINPIQGTPPDQLNFDYAKDETSEDICPRCKNLHCDVLGCNPKVTALKCGCSPNYCTCTPEEQHGSGA